MTNKLMVNEALRLGVKPMVAGHTAERLKPLADVLGLESRAFEARMISSFVEHRLAVIPIFFCEGIGHGYVKANEIDGSLQNFKQSLDEVWQTSGTNFCEKICDGHGLAVLTAFVICG